MTVVSVPPVLLFQLVVFVVLYQVEVSLKVTLVRLPQPLNA